MSFGAAPNTQSLLKNGGGSSRSLGSSEARMSLHNVGGSNRSLGSSLTAGSSSLRSSRRVKRTIRRQQAKKDTSSFSFTNALVGSLADAAQAFLYPETTTTASNNNKENARSSDNKNAVNSSIETADTSDDAFYDEEEETLTSVPSTTTGRSLYTPTPPPNLGAVVPAAVKRPIPVSSPNSSFDPVFPSSFGVEQAQPSPIARMRAPPSSSSPEQAPQEPSYDEQSRYSENFVADKHRKWRRQIKLQRKRLASQQEDETSLLTTCGGASEGDYNKTKNSSSNKQQQKPKRQQKPVNILAQLMRAPCAGVDDVMATCEEGAMSSDDEDDDERNNSLIDPNSYDDDSSHYDTSVTEESEEGERQSDFTGGTESTVSSSRRQSPSSAGGNSARSSSAPGNATTSGLRGVLKASSFGNSSIQTGSSTLPPDIKVIAVQPRDKNFIKSFVEELTRDGTLLIWHGPQGDSTAFRRPCGVIAHLKLGAPTNGGSNYDGPRLVWQKQDGSDGGVIDLFDIQSMDTASIDMLESYQFAIPENTFFVVLNNGKHVVFEASSDTDAKRFIHGLRWVVARLSFNLVVGNPLVSCELLSVGGSESPQTPMEEALWSKAMNDVTNHLVDKSLTKVAAEHEE